MKGTREKGKGQNNKWEIGKRKWTWKKGGKWKKSGWNSNNCKKLQKYKREMMKVDIMETFCFQLFYTRCFLDSCLSLILVFYILWWKLVSLRRRISKACIIYQYISILLHRDGYSFSGRTQFLKTNEIFREQWCRSEIKKTMEEWLRSFKEMKIWFKIVLTNLKKTIVFY